VSPLDRRIYAHLSHLDDGRHLRGLLTVIYWVGEGSRAARLAVLRLVQFAEPATRPKVEDMAPKGALRRLGLAAALVLCTCDWKQQDDFTEQDWELIRQMVLPPLPPQDPALAGLGQQLFFESEISGNIVTSH